MGKMRKMPMPLACLAARRLHHVDRVHVHDPAQFFGRLNLSGHLADRSAQAIAVRTLHVKLIAEFAAELRQWARRGSKHARGDLRSTRWFDVRRWMFDVRCSSLTADC